MMRALLAVDDPSSSAILAEALVWRGWQVDHAGSDTLTLEELHDDTPDLLAIRDSNGGGSDLCRQIRRSLGERSPYVLGVAWKNDLGAFRHLVQAGSDDVIGAPFDLGEAETHLLLAEARLGAMGPARFASDPAVELGEIRRKLHVQQALLEGIFESAPEGIVVLDERDRVARINTEFTRMFGYTPDEAVGQPLNDLIVPDSLRTEGDALDVGVRRGERVMLETVRRHRDGHQIEVSVLATTIDVNGPAGAFGIYRDITERKRQEAALRESEARYRALFDQSPVGVFLCDGDLRITHCNEYLTVLIDAPYEEIVGADLLRLRNSRLLPGLRAALGGEPAFYEGSYRTRTGKQLYVSVQYAPLRDEDGRVIGGIGVLENISHRVTAEKLRRAQATEMERVNAALRERTLELEAAMRARSQLYSALNHELRTPISAIMLYQELLMAGSLGPLGEEQRRALEHSNTAARHLLDLVRDILDLSKMEAGKVSVQPVEVGLAGLLQELHASVSPLTERYGSPLHLDIDPEIGQVVTDPQRVRQILLNFVSNAAKYGRKAPITVRCARLQNRQVVLEVVDRGIGIAEEDLNHIFEDFVQLGAQTSEGTGLGLAICRRLAELLDARLEVESKLGVGSTFRLILPVREDQAMQRALGRG
jgi:PAS domain S-box-containing protein